METDKHIETLSDIRNMMERSTRFVSLSGLSGVFVGLFALAGAWRAYRYVDSYNSSLAYYELANTAGPEFYRFFFVDAVCVLLLSVIVSSLMSMRKARRNGESAWTPTSKRLLINMLIPLLSGGIFCLILLYQNMAQMVVPVMLIFYGLALVNAGKYTYDDIRTLGLIEIALGLMSAIDPRHGLFFWALGFGLMHIIYGIGMYYKYERSGRERG
jgi:uncharacterized membrane protein